MASGVYLKESAWDAPFVVWIKMQNRRDTDLRRKKRGGIILSEDPKLLLNCR